MAFPPFLGECGLSKEVTETRYRHHHACLPCQSTMQRPLGQTSHPGWTPATGQCGAVSSPATCIRGCCRLSSFNLAQHFNIYPCSPCFLRHCDCSRIDFRIYLGPFFFFFFFAHTWVGKMHICIEIIFSELSLQVCQIYKHHDYKDIFLDLGFLLGLFLLSFVMFWVTLHWIYWVGNFVF